MKHNFGYRRPQIGCVSSPEASGSAGFGLRLAAARRNAGLTQEALGQRIGRSLNTVSRYERGITQPSLSVLRQLGQILGASLETLLQGTNPP